MVVIHFKINSRELIGIEERLLQKHIQMCEDRQAKLKLMIY